MASIDRKMFTHNLDFALLDLCIHTYVPCASVCLNIYVYAHTLIFIVYAHAYKYICTFL